MEISFHFSSSKFPMPPMKDSFSAFLLIGLFLVAGDKIVAALSPVEDGPPVPERTSDSVPVSDTSPQGLAKTDWASIREAHEAWLHLIMPLEGRSGVWQARNPGQQWTTLFDGRGFTTSPKGAPWQWGLELRSYGFGQSRTVVGGMPEVKTVGGRLTYRWDQQIEEWFVNDQRGLEHGFMLRERPAGASVGQPLEVVMAVRGGLRAGLSGDRQTVHFSADPSAPMVNYGGLKVWDADGTILPSRFEPAGEKQVRLVVEEAGARYPVTIDPLALQAYLKPSAEPAPFAAAGDEFGYAVAVSGDTVVVGAYREDSSTTGVNSIPNENSPASGAAFVFFRSGGSWSQQAYLKPHQISQLDNFGTSVAVNGDTIVVGAPGEDSSTAGINSTPNEDSPNAGAAYVFFRSGGIWSQQAYLKSHQVSQLDDFGGSVSVDGDTVVVGASGEDSSTTGINSKPDEWSARSGAAYIFLRTGSTWNQQAYLKAGKNSLFGHFGDSVAVSGNTVVAGSPYEPSSTTGVNSIPNEAVSEAGAAYVFSRSGGIWSQQAYLKAHQVSQFDNFGTSVAVSGDSVLVGASGEDSSSTGVNSTPNEGAPTSGAAYVFVRSGSMWSQQAYLKASQVNEGDVFGLSVAISGDTAVVGAYGEDSSSTGVNSIPNEWFSSAGAAYVFSRNGSTWNQQAYLKAGQTSGDDRFGWSVAVSGSTVVVGAYGEGSTTTGVNSIPNEAAPNSGAAYVFTDFGPVVLTPIEQWRQLHFGTPANTGDAADRFDFDRDGLVNLLEWAAGTPPKQENPYQPTLVRNGPVLRFTYSRSLAAFNAGTGYVVEWSATLEAGTWQTTGVVQSSLSSSGDRQTVTVTVPSGSTRRYVRLRVTTP